MTQPVPGKTFRFSPNVGALEYRLVDFSSAIARGGDSRNVLRHFVASDILPPSDAYSEVDELRWAVALSLLDDLVFAGARLDSRDTCLNITWPDWSTSESRDQLRRALARLREEPGALSKAPISPSAVAALPGDLPGEKILILLREGRFRLREASEIYSGSLTFREIFRAGIRSWSMPHRDREGRRVQFVLTVEHASLNRPLPFGLIEAGDGPPFLTLRDKQLALSREAFLDWLGNPAERMSELASIQDRLHGLLGALRLSAGHRRGDLDRTLRNIESLRRVAAGRSKGDAELADAKKAVYLDRLSRALSAANALASGRKVEQTDIYALTRVIRDISLPRLNVELSICGALPPFSFALGGKLVAAFAADPRITSICKRPPGPILTKAFWLDRLEPLLPKTGAVLVTTQGLYAEHSAQYTGVNFPSVRPEKAVKLKKLGTTSGATTSLISRRTDRLAAELMEALGATSSVSKVYGSGGSKRQRRLEDAISLLGVRPEIMHPGIPRPVYGIELASNLPEIAVLNAAPNWAVDRPDCPDEYAQLAVREWRKRWLETAERRLRQSDSGNSLHAGVRGLLAS